MYQPLVICLVLALSGCVGVRPPTPPNPCMGAQTLTPACFELLYADARPYLHISVATGVALYLHKYPKRAEAAVQVLRHAQRYLDANELVILADLQRLIERRIDWKSLSPEAQLAAKGLIVAVKTAVEEFLQRANVPAQDIPFVRVVSTDILTWATTAAEAHCPACLQQKLPRA